LANCNQQSIEVNTKDYVVQATAANGRVRALAAVVTGIADEIARRHEMWPVAAAALGRTLAATAMIGAMQKGKEKVTVQIIGDGPLEQITADGDGEGNLRGYVQNPYVDLPLTEQGKLNVGAAVGKGHLWVIRDLGLGEPYRGGVPLVSGEIAEDFASYFAQSEQTPSAVALGVLTGPDGGVRAAGGLIIQLLPEASEGLAVVVEQMVADLPSVSGLIDTGSTPEDIIQRTIGDLQPKYLRMLPLRFTCTCSRERCESALIALGAEELDKLIEEQGKAELTCRFCRAQYLFDKEELKNLQARIEKTRT